MVDPVNATGWVQLIDGNMTSAVMTMFNAAFGGAGWIILILFFTYQIIAWVKTENALLVWTSSTLFIAATWGANILSWTTVANKTVMVILFATIVFELAGILYAIPWMKK